MSTATTSNRFVQLRFRRGVTQGEISKATGLSRGTLSNLERGSDPSAPTALKLAQFYGVTVEQIIGYEPLDGPDSPMDPAA
jgi:transcriptional regulator with XRE-family HTH domain